MPAPSDSALIDRVDDDNRVIGQVRRADALRLAVGFRTVHVLVFTSAGQLVLQRIGLNGTRDPDELGSSMAGYLFAGESYEEGARRRIREELGIDPPLQPVGVTSMEDGRSRKFVGVFYAVNDSAYVADPGHIAALEAWNFGDVQMAVRSDPERFTETFRHVLSFFVRSVGSPPR